MSEENIIIDENLDGTIDSPEEFNMASTGQRFVNSLVDSISFYVIIFFIAFVLELADMSVIDQTGEANPFFSIGSYGLWIAYYTIIEGATGRSVGKYVTGTKIVNANGEKPSFGTAFKRSLSRIVPFEAFTAFSSSKRMWHDKWTDTWLIKAR